MTWFFFRILTQEKPLIYFDMIPEPEKKNITNITTIIWAKEWKQQKNKTAKKYDKFDDIYCTDKITTDNNNTRHWAFKVKIIFYHLYIYVSLNVLWYISSNIFLSMRWIALFKASFYLCPQQQSLLFLAENEQIFPF